jgi:hypothetical protein
MAPIGKGVRKVNESIMQDGRTIIITEVDDSQLDWDRIPDGTLKVHPVTGQLFIKIQGEGGWIPAGLTYDGNLTIAKDARIVYEVFRIVRSDNGDGTFTYAKEDGEQRTKPLTADGKQAFELEKGSYIVKRNKIEAIINDTLHRSATAGGLTEIDETRISLDEKLVDGTKVTLKYFLKVNIGNPYPRFFINAEEPNTADYGDFWLDLNEDQAILKWWDGDSWEKLSAEDIEEILGANMVYTGFNVIPGTGRSVTINHGADSTSALFIDGVRFRESQIISDIAITANSSGATRTDTLYAAADSNKLVYGVAAGTTVAPAGSAKLAEIKVPNGATTIAASNITLVRKAMTIKFISDEIYDSTNEATPNTLMRRDSGGRVKAAAPVEDDDVVRKAENDLKVAKAGDTMTGQLTIDGFGLLPKMTGVAATVAGSSYKSGITTFNTGTLTGYPAQNAIAVNYKLDDNAVTQWIFASGAGGEVRSWFRHWNTAKSTNNGWSDTFKEVRDLGETADTAYRGDRGKIAYDHSQVLDANPHETQHDQLLNKGELDVTSTNTTKNKHLSNAQGKKWEDHVNTTNGTNPHQTNHDSLLNRGEVDPTSTDTTKNKHLSNAQAKKWEDHANADSPHANHLIAVNYTTQRVFVQSTKPTSGMEAGDIWIDTSVSYGTK